MDIADVGFLKAGDQQSSLVETPEDKASEAPVASKPKTTPKPKAARTPRPRKPRAPKVAAADNAETSGSTETAE
jgi:hypothetical protein